MKVLLIEDSVSLLIQWKREFKEEGFKDVTCVESIARALEEFPLEQWDAISFDGCIGGDDFNSPPLIKKFKAECKPGCIMIAASSNEDLRQLMLQAGCTHEVRSKHHVPGIIIHLLSKIK
jgi:DNA-binding response OmpR family regulator